MFHSRVYPWPVATKTKQLVTEGLFMVQSWSRDYRVLRVVLDARLVSTVCGRYKALVFLKSKAIDQSKQHSQRPSVDDIFNPVFSNTILQHCYCSFNPRMYSLLALFSSASLLGLATLAYAGFDLSSSNNVAVYWGKNTQQL